MKTLKNEIAEILVKWNMPTRQVAINEIVSLFTKEKHEVYEKVYQDVAKRFRLREQTLLDKQKEELIKKIEDFSEEVGWDIRALDDLIKHLEKS